MEHNAHVQSATVVNLVAWRNAAQRSRPDFAERFELARLISRRIYAVSAWYHDEAIAAEPVAFNAR